MSALLRRSGIELSPFQLDQLWTYHQLLRDFNPQLNLTRIHNFSNMVLKLYVDSMLPAQMIDLPSPLLDLGTGAGMPGIPLKIFMPHLEILLAESRKNRSEFIEEAVSRLKLQDVQVVAEGIHPGSEYPVNGVITRAVESVSATLSRIEGCLSRRGLAIFMKGPRCGDEIDEAVERHRRTYRLVRDVAYSIPGTAHERRLVVFERLDEPAWSSRAAAMKRHPYRKIESEHNEIFKDLKKLHASRGIRKQGQALVCGRKLIGEVLRDFPELCKAWISSDDRSPPPADAPAHIAWIQLATSLFRTLDLFGTGAPLLQVETPEINEWDPSSGFPPGCSILIPFQDPENVGTLIRSAAAFGAARVILLSESAHPWHPRALRASGVPCFTLNFYTVPQSTICPRIYLSCPFRPREETYPGLTFPRPSDFCPEWRDPACPTGGVNIAFPYRSCQAWNPSTPQRLQPSRSSSGPGKNVKGNACRGAALTGCDVDRVRSSGVESADFPSSRKKKVSHKRAPGQQLRTVVPQSWNAPPTPSSS